MLTPFPDLLVYSFFAPTLLRLAAAGVLFYLAWVYVQKREEIGQARFPFIGVTGSWIAWWIALVSAAVGAMLFFGWYTQIAAILGLLGGIKYALYRRLWPQLIALRFPLAQSTLILFCVICLSLLFTGAGAYALDVRL